jgi:hypothetical protein
MCRATVSAVVPEAEKTRIVASIPWQTGGAASGGRTTESVIRSARDGSCATASHLCVASMICLPNFFLCVVASEQEHPITSVPFHATGKRQRVAKTFGFMAYGGNSRTVAKND